MLHDTAIAEAVLQACEIKGLIRKVAIYTGADCEPRVNWRMFGVQCERVHKVEAALDSFCLVATRGEIDVRKDDFLDFVEVVVKLCAYSRPLHAATTLDRVEELLDQYDKVIC